MYVLFLTYLEQYLDWLRKCDLILIQLVFKRTENVACNWDTEKQLKKTARVYFSLRRVTKEMVNLHGSTKETMRRIC